jgi:hypothetical protein
MKFHRQTAIRLLDGGLIGIPGNPEDFIQIPFSHRTFFLP